MDVDSFRGYQLFLETVLLGCPASDDHSADRSDNRSHTQGCQETEIPTDYTTESLDNLIITYHEGLESTLSGKPSFHSSYPRGLQLLARDQNNVTIHCSAYNQLQEHFVFLAGLVISDHYPS